MTEPTNLVHVEEPAPLYVIATFDRLSDKTEAMRRATSWIAITEDEALAFLSREQQADAT